MTLNVATGLETRNEYKSAAEVEKEARNLLRHSKRGMGERMLVCVLMADDDTRPLIGFVPSAGSPKGYPHYINRGLARMRRSKDWRYTEDGRWQWIGGDKHAETPESDKRVGMWGVNSRVKEQRKCKKCGCIMRSSQPEDYCDPCQGDPEVQKVMAPAPIDDDDPWFDGAKRNRWNKSSIINAIQNWHKIHGSAPIRRQWKSKTHGHPDTKTVLRHFPEKSWDDIIREAGLEPQPKGYRGARKRPFTGTTVSNIEVEQQVMGGGVLPATTREIADRFERSYDSIKHTMITLEKAGLVDREEIQADRTRSFAKYVWVNKKKPDS